MVDFSFGFFEMAQRVCVWVGAGRAAALSMTWWPRRCFVGNLNKQVEDPNLVGALSGHKEGSRAFASYREIDEQMKRDLVSMLE